MKLGEMKEGVDEGMGVMGGQENGSLLPQLKSLLMLEFDTRLMERGLYLCVCGC